MIFEIHENVPHAKYVALKGEIDAWDSPDFAAAVKATCRKTLIIAGTIKRGRGLNQHLGLQAADRELYEGIGSNQ